MNDVCFCDKCFDDGDDGLCVVEFIDKCYYYDSSTASCQDNCCSKLVAFLLSFFLTGVGSANFYIGQDSLAAGPVSLLGVMLLITCCALCSPCCLPCLLCNGMLRYVGTHEVD